MAKNAKRDDAAERKRREDGMANVLTGLGVTGKDKRLSTTIKVTPAITDTMLAELYRGNGLVRRICELEPREMTRNWFTIAGDEDDSVLQKMEVLGAQEAYTDAMIWGRLFGGAVILMGVDDGRDPSEPVDEDRITDISYLKVFDKSDVHIDHDSISTDPTNPLFGQPTMYTVHPMTGGNQFAVHASRLIRFDGGKVPNITLRNNRNAGWHDSIILSVYEQVRALDGAYASAEFIMQDFVQTIIKAGNIANLIAAGKDDQVKDRLNLIDLGRHVANTILLDSNEDYAKHSSTVTGLEVLIDRFMMYVASAAGMPVTLLMGRSPAGQNATGESDIRMWYDSNRSKQRSYLRPRLETLIRYCFKIAGEEPKTWSVEFNPLWEMTDKEWAEVYKLNAEGDRLYYDMGMDADKIEQHRFGGQEYDANPPTYEVEEGEDDLTEAERAKRQLEAEAAAAEE